MEQRGDAGAAFVPTDTIVEGSVVFGMPEVLLDEPHRTWSFKRARGGKRVVLSFDDVASCRIVEDGADSAAPAPQGARGVLSVLTNPAAVSRGNAARRGKTCLSMTVEVVLRPPLSITLEIPVWRRPVRRSERLYRELRGQAEEICGRFEAMCAGRSDDQAQ